MAVRRFSGGEIPHRDRIPWRATRHWAADRTIGAAASPAPTLKLGPLTINLDGVFVFGLFLSMLLTSEFAAKAIAVFAAIVPFYLWTRRRDAIWSLLQNTLLLLIPGLALFSVLWSEAPGATARYAIQFGLTVTAALLMSSAKDQQAVLRGITAAFLVYIVASVAVGGSVGVGVGSGGSAFSGLTDSKNLVADVAATGILVSVVVGFLAFRRGNYIWLAACVVAVLLDVYVLIGARSAGAILSAGAGLMAMAALAPLGLMHPAVRAALVVVVTTAIVIVGLGYRWISAALITLASDVFDKDPTLTGRTYLWYRASDLIAEKPALGRGYFAFWLQGNIDAEGLWRYAGIRSRSGFTFHNAAVEILVGLGYVGLAVIGTAVLIAAVILAVRVVREPTPVLAFWLVILLYELSRAPIESVGMTPFYHSTVLVFAALGAAFGKRATSWVAPGPAGKPVSFRAAPYEESRANAALSIPHAGGSMRLRQPADQAPLQPR